MLPNSGVMSIEYSCITAKSTICVRDLRTGVVVQSQVKKVLKSVLVLLLQEIHAKPVRRTTGFPV